MNQWDKKNLRVQRKVAARKGVTASIGCVGCIVYALGAATVVGVAAAVVVNVFNALT